MSAFYDQASLVVVPSGYKSGKIYAQKPLTTDGQLTFTRASTATRVNASGLIETVASGLPRLDYLNSTCPRLLLEPQRTNLIIYSEQFDNAGWGKSQSGTGLVPVVTANNAISPDGYQNADTIVFDAGAGTTASDISAIFQTFGGTTATYTASFYAKTASGTAQVQVRIDGSNYDKFTITNQWQRFTLTKALTGTSNVFEMAIRRGLNEPMNASATIQLWGVQVELGAYATSYIPTLGTSVTRVLDRAFESSASALIGQTEGTLFGEFVFDSSENVNRVFSITGTDWNTDGSIRLDIIANKPEIYARKGGADIGSAGSLPYTINKGATVKFALVYTASTMKLFIAGAQIGSAVSLSTTPPACSLLYVNELGGGFSSLSQNNQRTLWKQVLLFTSALTDSQAIELTTL